MLPCKHTSGIQCASQHAHSLAVTAAWTGGAALHAKVPAAVATVCQPLAHVRQDASFIRCTTCVHCCAVARPDTMACCTHVGGCPTGSSLCSFTKFRPNEKMLQPRQPFTVRRLECSSSLRDMQAKRYGMRPSQMGCDSSSAFWSTPRLGDVDAFWREWRVWMGLDGRLSW